MKKVKKNWLEWAVFAVGLVLVLSVLGYLTYTGASMGNQSPDIEVRLGTPEQKQFNFIVPVTVINHGDETAASLRIEVVMEGNGQEQSQGELDIPFLPRHAKREGWVTFDRDPRSSQLRARVLGYQKP